METSATIERDSLIHAVETAWAHVGFPTQAIDAMAARTSPDDIYAKLAAWLMHRPRESMSDDELLVVARHETFLPDAVIHYYVPRILIRSIEGAPDLLSYEPPSSSIWAAGPTRAFDWPQRQCMKRLWRYLALHDPSSVSIIDVEGVTRAWSEV